MLSVNGKTEELLKRLTETICKIHFESIDKNKVNEPDMPLNKGNLTSFIKEILKEEFAKQKNNISNLINGNFEITVKEISTIVNKTFFFAGDFNINLWLWNEKKVQSFVNLMFEFSLIPRINKPTRVTKYTATALDNIITNFILNSDFKSAILKTDLCDHFPITFINEFIRDPTLTYDMEKCICKWDFTEKHALFETSWDSVKIFKQPNKAYNNKFLEIFTELYEKHFPERKIKIKPKRALSPWITNDIAKLSKRKQKLYEKFLKCCTPINKANY